ncbi:MAG: hypothetical protein NTW47_07120 [Proteobacteria bacterium]|nr:hypothetical protein [Pseudomonadota bacterium]
MRFDSDVVERTLLSKEWSTDLGGASGVEIVSSKLEKGKEMSSATSGAKVAAAELETNEIQDLADCVSAIKKAAAGSSCDSKYQFSLVTRRLCQKAQLTRSKRCFAKVKAG